MAKHTTERRPFNRSKAKPSMAALRNFRVTAEARRCSRSSSVLIPLSSSLSFSLSLPVSLRPCPLRLLPRQLRHSLFTMDGIKTALYRDILRGLIRLRVQCSYRGMPCAVFSNRNTNPSIFHENETHSADKYSLSRPCKFRNIISRIYNIELAI